MKKIFISGALNGFESNAENNSFVNNVYKMLQVAGEVRGLGAATYVPCQDVLTSFATGGLSHEEYYAHDLVWLEHCDALILVPGWEVSKGVEGEIKRAQELNIPIFETIEDLEEFLEV